MGQEQSSTEERVRDALAWTWAALAAWTLGHAVEAIAGEGWLAVAVLAAALMLTVMAVRRTEQARRRR